MSCPMRGVAVYVDSCHPNHTSLLSRIAYRVAVGTGRLLIGGTRAALRLMKDCDTVLSS
jgi:hypothetical protein